MAIIIAGMMLIIGAAYGIYSGYAIGDWMMSSIGWIGLILGALTVLFGFGKRASERMRDPVDTENEHAQAEIKAMVQAMGMVTVADGEIRDQEIETIARIHEQMLGLEISTSEINEILSEFGPDFDITKRLTQERGKISPQMKRIIIQSCYLVMVSDLEIVKHEENRIHEIGLALGFDQEEIDDLIASAGT